MTRRVLSLLLVPALAGCPIGNEKYPKPRDLTPSWKVDRLRVLAIRAEPPEIRPGEETRLSALVVAPDEEEIGLRVWTACPPESDDGTGFGCGFSPDLDFSSATPEQLAEAGFIGVEPGLAPRYRAPEDLLDGLTEFEAADGVYVLVQLAVLPPDVLDEGAREDFDFNEIEVAYKRVVVSSVNAPNLNPVVGGFTVDGVAVPPGSVLEVERGQAYDIGLWLVEQGDEVYDYTNADGVTTTRTEEPYAAWYATGGEVTEPITLFGWFESTWYAPTEDDPDTSGSIWVVVRDRRGGMAWNRLDWRVRL